MRHCCYGGTAALWVRGAERTVMAVHSGAAGDASWVLLALQLVIVVTWFHAAGEAGKEGGRGSQGRRQVSCGRPPLPAAAAPLVMIAPAACSRGNTLGSWAVVSSTTGTNQPLFSDIPSRSLAFY